MINGEDKLLTAQNKWLIAHEETQIPGSVLWISWRKYHIKMIKKERMENQMSNMPKVKIEIVAVSRDCFPESLSVNRRNITCQTF